MALCAEILKVVFTLNVDVVVKERIILGLCGVVEDYYTELRA